MYPYFVLGTLKIYMTGIGILIAIIVFLIFTYKFSKRYGLNFWNFFNWLPLFLIIPYIFGNLFSFIINTGNFFPTNFYDILAILSPYGFKFSFIGVSLGLIIFLYFFFKNIQTKSEVNKWIDVFFYSMCISLIPLGFFLLMGDNFIGIQTDSILGVSAFKEDSELYKYSKVYPIGIFLSLLGVFTFMIILFINYFIKNYGIGIFGYIILLIGINFIFLIQEYSRHIVYKFGSITFDIKNYWIFLLIFFLFFYYFFSKEKGK